MFAKKKRTAEKISRAIFLYRRRGHASRASRRAIFRETYHNRASHFNNPFFSGHLVSRFRRVYEPVTPRLSRRDRSLIIARSRFAPLRRARRESERSTRARARAGVWDYTCSERTVGRHATRRDERIGSGDRSRARSATAGANIAVRRRPRRLCLFKFGSTRGKQAGGYRARQTRETCVRGSARARWRLPYTRSVLIS